MVWFKFYIAWDDVIQELTDAEAGRFLKALMAYEKTGEIKSLTGTERIMYNVALKQAKQDAEHVAEISKIRSEARRGTQKSKTINSNNSNQMITNDNNCKEMLSNDTQIKDIKIKDIKNKDLNICAEAHDSAPKSANVTPDDHDFWKFAKDNAELAETFYRTTGIVPVKSQFGRWVKDLRDLAEAGINAEQLRKTINYMQTEGIQISAPGSCLKTAQWLKSRGSVPVRSQSKQKPAYNAFEQLAMQMNGIPEPSWDVEL